MSRRSDLLWTILVGAVLVAVVLVVPTEAAPTGFGPNVQVNVGPSPFLLQMEPSLVLDDQGRLVVGWIEREPVDPTGTLMFPVAASHSMDEGSTWSPRIFMDFLRPMEKRLQTDPWLTVDDAGRVHYARLEFTEFFEPQGITVSRSDDGGGTWSSPTAAVEVVGHFVDKDEIASDRAGNLYVAYTDAILAGPTPFQGIFVARSPDDGATWLDPVPVSGPSAAVGNGLVARPNGEVYTAWWDQFAGNVLVDRSFDFGATWHDDVRVNPVRGTALADPTNFFKSPLPSLAVTSKGALFVAWAQGPGRDLDVFVARSHDRGATWSLPVRVNDDASGREQWQPNLAVGPDDAVHLAWMDNRTDNYNVFYASSKDGRRWSSDLRVTDAETSSGFDRPGDYLSLVVDSRGTAYAAWTDGRAGDLDIFFARRPGSGGGPRSAAYEGEPSIAIASRPDDI